MDELDLKSEEIKIDIKMDTKPQKDSKQKPKMVSMASIKNVFNKKRKQKEREGNDLVEYDDIVEI